MNGARVDKMISFTGARFEYKNFFSYPNYINVMISLTFLVISCERCSLLPHFIHAWAVQCMSKQLLGVCAADNLSTGLFHYNFIMSLPWILISSNAEAQSMWMRSPATPGQAVVFEQVVL